jgi:hypothetical protein
MQRFDFVFSYWMFAWYVAYMVGLVPYNPSLFIILGGVVNLAEFFTDKIKNPRLFILVNIFIKVLPIVSLIRTPVRPVDIQAGFVYFATYLGWMFINKEDWLKVRTPFTDFIKDKYPSLVNG